MKGHDGAPTGRPGTWAGPGDERGFSLMEAIVATIIAVLAVIGLAHTFGLGHGLIDSYASSRAALGEAQRRMEWLGTLPVSSDSIQVDGLYPSPAGTFSVPGVVSGTYQWSAAPDTIFGVANAMRRVTVLVVYPLGGASDTLRLSRLFQHYP